MKDPGQVNRLFPLNYPSLKHLQAEEIPKFWKSAKGQLLSIHVQSITLCLRPLRYLLKKKEWLSVATYLRRWFLCLETSFLYSTCIILHGQMPLLSSFTFGTPSMHEAWRRAPNYERIDIAGHNTITSYDYLPD